MNNKLILLVDDEEEILTIYGSVLKNAGFEVITAPDGLKAIEIAKEKNPDLILLDLKMPAMNGAEAFLEMKDDPQLKNTKIVFLTAFSDPEKVEIDEKFAKEAGAFDFIKKGISLEEFAEKVKGYLK
ncbi:MAG: response regulator [Candidatus Paceibacterota bacterium]